MKIRTILLLCISLFLSLPILAQNDKQIKLVFDTYGKQKGSVMVQLSTDILSPKSKITLYKSLVSEKRDDLRVYILEMIANKELQEISIVKKNGKLTNAVYLISQRNGVGEYILYNDANKITFVYIRGDFPPKELDNELKKLKELFIYINKNK